MILRKRYGVFRFVHIPYNVWVAVDTDMEGAAATITRSVISEQFYVRVVDLLGKNGIGARDKRKKTRMPYLVGVGDYRSLVAAKRGAARIWGRYLKECQAND